MGNDVDEREGGIELHKPLSHEYLPVYVSMPMILAVNHVTALVPTRQRPSESGLQR